MSDYTGTVAGGISFAGVVTRQISIMRSTAGALTMAGVYERSVKFFRTYTGDLAMTDNDKLEGYKGIFYRGIRNPRRAA